MYTENIRRAIKVMEDEQYEEFLIKLRKTLKYKLNTDVKPSELKKQVENFLQNKIEKISIKYLEGYLLTLDELSVDGGFKAIFQGKVTAANTWRDLLIISTQDQPLPRDIDINLDDDLLIKEIKVLFINALKYCANENKETFRNNVHIINSFLSIRKDLE
ncbi:hypothetical protein MKX73_05990 [Solibacillus sp. FSL W7-1436]|uniref:hypothetical protein n=1 Tax=unclassified Solibacillus TaxID=2637870 RepID=UPI0030F8D1AF